MINTKQDLIEYLAQDKLQLGITRKRPRPFTDEIWKYEIVLRKYEYWINQKKGIISSIFRFYYKFLWHRKGIQLGISIGPNTCGKGLSIAHINGIQINNNARVGENLRIQECVTIGASGGADAPIIGNNVFLASGAKVMGKVVIADDCVVGANAVVVKDVLEEGITVAGIPAKKISNNNSEKFVFFYKNRTIN